MNTHTHTYIYNTCDEGIDVISLENDPNKIWIC